MADGQEVSIVVEDQFPRGSHTNGGRSPGNNETIMDKVDLGETIFRLDRCGR